MSRNRGRIWATVFAVPTIALLCSTTASAVPGCTGMCAGTIVNAPSYEEYEVIGTGTGVDDAITTAYCDAGDSLVAGGHEMTDVDGDTTVTLSAPDQNGAQAGWRVAANLPDGGDNIRAKVVCFDDHDPDH